MMADPHVPRVVQTRSSAWNWDSHSRWLGAERFPWDRPVITADPSHAGDVVALEQPGGHSDVFKHPEKYEDFWRDAVRLLNRVEKTATSA